MSLNLILGHRVEASGLINHQVVQAELARGLWLLHLCLFSVEHGALLVHSLLHHLHLLVAILLLLIDHDLSMTKVVLVLIFVAILVDLVHVLVKLQVTHAVHRVLALQPRRQQLLPRWRTFELSFVLSSGNLLLQIILLFYLF